MEQTRERGGGNVDQSISNWGMREDKVLPIISISRFVFNICLLMRVNLLTRESNKLIT